MVQLKEGAQVMLIRTLSVRKGLVNGSRGVVEKFVGGALKLPVVRFANVSQPFASTPGCETCDLTILHTMCLQQVIRLGHSSTSE